MRRAFVCHYLPSACKLGHYLRYHRGSIPPTTRSRRRGDPHTSAVFSQAARERYLRPSALTARTGYGTTRTVDDGGAALILAFVGVLMRIGCFIARVLGRTPNLRFEFLATWPAAIWLRGPKSPFVRPETGLGEGVTFAARRGREVAHLGPNMRVFQRPLDILWTEKSKLASMLVVWSPRGPGYMTWGECVGAAGYPMGCQIGRLTRHETPLRLARPSQATKISKPNRFAYPSRSRPRGVYRPLWLIWHRPRHLVIEIRQIWGWCPPPSLHKSLHPSLYL